MLHLMRMVRGHAKRCAKFLKPSQRMRLFADSVEGVTISVEKHREYAEKCKVSWPRTGLALRRIADYYDAQAKWQDEHAEARD